MIFKRYKTEHVYMILNKKTAWSLQPLFAHQNKLGQQVIYTCVI
jgi:hypothetical protein